MLHDYSVAYECNPFVPLDRHTEWAAIHRKWGLYSNGEGKVSTTFLLVVVVVVGC